MTPEKRKGNWYKRRYGTRPDQRPEPDGNSRPFRALFQGKCQNPICLHDNPTFEENDWVRYFDEGIMHADCARRSHTEIADHFAGRSTE